MEGHIKHKSEVLRAQDIIPSTELKAEKGNSANDGIPRFDLATEIMAQQRKLTSSRRKRPENQIPPTKEESPVKTPAASAKAPALRTCVHASVIAEIVRQDIQRMLLKGGGPQV
jgi:hypothetical protein